MKRIGLISDTHGYMDDRILEYFNNSDEIWHAGDIGNLEITDLLSQVAPVKAVYGNIDNAKIRSEYPLHQRFLCEKVDVWITHIGGPIYVYDHRIRDEIRNHPPKLFVCGHSHICKVQMDKRLNMLYMNPGAAGNHGFHKMRTILRFVIDGIDIKNLEVIELGIRGKKSV